MKNSYFHIVLLILLQTVVYSQDTKFTYGVETNLGISDRMFISEGPLSDFIKETQSKIEKSKFGYEVGLILEYKISKSIGIQSGLKFVSWGYKSDKQSFESSPDPAFPNAIRYASNNTYLDIPFKVNFYKNIKQQNFFINVGVSPSINLSNKLITTQYFEDRTLTKKSKDQATDYRKVNLLGEIGLGWQKSISENLFIFINPNFRIQAFGIASDVPLNRRLIFYGVNFGFKFRSK